MRVMSCFPEGEMKVNTGSFGGSRSPGVVSGSLPLWVLAFFAAKNGKEHCKMTTYSGLAIHYRLPFLRALLLVAA